MSETQQTRAGIIGLGAMGIGMAQSLVAKDFAVAAFDLSDAALTRAADAGATPMPDADSVFAAADIIVLSLPAAHHVEAVIAGAARAGHLAKGAAPRTVIDTSTSEAGISRKLAAMLDSAGHGFVDAPVSGGPSGAAAGTLAMMLGGADAHVARAMPVLETLGRKIIHVGPSGAGNVAKLVNNMLVASHMVTTLEAVKLAEASGVSAADALGVVNAATGRSAISEIHYPNWVLSRSFDSGFSTGLMRKDVRLALEMAEQAGCAMPLASLVSDLWSEARSGLTDSDDFMLMGDPQAHRFEGDK